MAEDSTRVNPYRFGVLEGNHVEERFALDHLGNQVLCNHKETKTVTSINHEG